MDPTFRLMATHRASIYAPPPVASGKRGEPVVLVEDVRCLPLDYVNAETLNRLGLAGATKWRQTFMEGQPSIPRGSHLRLDDSEVRYPVRVTEPWDWSAAAGSEQYTRVVVEALEA